MKGPRRSVLHVVLALLALGTLAPSPSLVAASSIQSIKAPLRVFLRGGKKTHGPGQHDHPQFVEDWKVLLAERGCAVDGALRFPTEDELAQTDVLVLYAAEGASIHGAEREALMRFLRRGGGLVALHDAVCGDDPQWFKSVAGGAWEHGHSKWKEGEIGLYFLDREHPITRGIANFDFDDEIYHELHMDSEAHVLAGGFETVFDVPPQTWTLEREGWRSFVSLQGHNHASFSHPTWRALLLRGLAWAGRRDVDSLLTGEELATLAYPPGGPTAPELAADALRLHPDFEVELVAAEPLVVNPIAIAWDHEQRLFAALTPGYPYKEESSGVPARDEIVILDDANGDGRMDSRRVFHSGLDLVTSLVVHEDGVIVSASPDILFLRDTDGDDVCDRVETLFTGFGYGDTHATVSHLRFGLDGWVYATQGYSGGASRSVTNADGRDFGHIPNGVFRFRPDGSAIELVSSYGSNTWGLDFNDEGELFFTMANGSHARQVVSTESALGRVRVNSVPSWTHLPDHGEVHPAVVRERDAYRQIDFVGGFTAAAGCLVYGGGLLPNEFNGDHFVCEPTVNLVHRDDLEPAGVRYVAKKPRRDEFMTSTDLWFRPVDVTAGPDGALYVLDFYNQAVIHNDTRGPEHGPTNAAVRPDRDRQHGRIWRVKPKAAPATARVELSNTKVLLRELMHANRWVRDTAQRRLRETWRPAFQPSVVRMAEDGRRPEGRVHALWLLANTNDGNGYLEATLEACLSDEDDRVRRVAARIAGTELLTVPAGVERGLWRLVGDADPRTRLAGLLGLARASIDSGEAGRLVALYGELDDDWSRSAALALLIDGPTRCALALETALDGDDDLVAELARRAAKHGPEGVRAALEALAGAAPSEAGAAQVTRALRELAGALPADIAAPSAAPALRRLLASDSLDVARAAVPVAARLDGEGALRADLDRAGARLLTLLRAEETSWSECLDCLRSLAGMPAMRGEAVGEAREFLLAHVPLDVQLEAIAILTEGEAAARDASVGALLASSSPTLGGKAREAAFDALLERPLWAVALLDGIEAGDLEPMELGPRRLHRLRQHPDAELAARAKRTLEARGPGLDAALLEEYLAVAREPGDAARGHELFTQQCATCHTFDGEGADIGPDLTGMGAHGVEELLTTILDPNREVDPSYLEVVVETTSGRMVTGILARETRDAVLLRNTGVDVEVPREEIDSMRTTGLSLMPMGFESLGADGLRDILAYIASDFAGYRVLDLAPFASASSSAGMYDPERDPGGYRFRKHGVVDVEGIPFDIPDPRVAPGGLDVVVLRGGPWDGWRTKTDAVPTRIEIPIGARIRGVHVLGGVAAWGHPWGSLRDQPACLWTWKLSDGTTKTVTHHDGDVYADWIRRHDVPGSTFVEGLLDGGRGQVRRFFEPVPGPPGSVAEVTSLVLESPGNHIAPTFLALTLELEDAPARGADMAATTTAAGAMEAAQNAPPSRADLPRTVFETAEAVIHGGGSSHDFHQWYGRTDIETVSGLANTLYTDRAVDVGYALAGGARSPLIAFCTNQELPAPYRAELIEHIDRGGPFFAMHPGTWRNWSWPAYYERLGGSSRSHEKLQEFRVELVEVGHPLTAGLPLKFTIIDELYRFEVGRDAGIRVLARGVSLETGATYPVLWVSESKDLRLAATTLGHDGRAHEHPAYQTLLRNAWAWLR